MIFGEAVDALATADNVLPREAMQWSLDHWDEAGPRFVRMLDDYASGAERTDAAADALFFVVHLIGDKADTSAFAALCRLLHDEAAANRVLGDATTETLRGIVIGAYDGDLGRLMAVIDDEATDVFIRDACLSALAYLTRIGRVPNTEMHEYLGRMLDALDPEVDDVLFCAAAIAIAQLGYDDFAPRVERLFQRYHDRYPIVDLAGFNEALANTRADPTGMVEFTRDHVSPFTDAIGTLEGWFGFSEEARRQNKLPEALAGSPRLPEEPYINPYRHVGRNDPCPCGSGKKYKKCCLA